MNKYIWWPGMYQSIHNYCRGCPSCQANKISMDLVMDLPLSGGKYDSILTIVDQGLTKGAFFLPTTKTVDSVGVADLYHAYVYPHWGVLEAIISDHGPQF
ncbi:hypothetical protein M404DRAFT_78801, partial [Pisolithus tinctorius Marx 270]